MMSSVAILNCYFQINLLLILSLLLFAIGRLILKCFGVRDHFLSSLRFAQFSVLSSLALPIVFSVATECYLPRLHFVAAQPYSDEVAITLRTRAAPRIEAAIPNFIRGQNGQKKSLSTLAQELKPSLIVLIFIVLISLAMLRALKLIKDIQCLQKLIHEAILFRRIGRVAILFSEAVSVPFSALLRSHAFVIVPQEVIANSSDLQIAIRHELQHHRQRDTAWAFWIEIVQCLFCINPAIYFWKRQIIELQEFSCDEALIGQRGVLSREYGGCLIRVAEAALESRQMLAGTACMATGDRNSRYFKSFLRRRIEMFNEYKIPRRKNAVATALGTLSVFATVAVAYGAQQALQAKHSVAPNPGHAVFDAEVQSIAQDELQLALKSYSAKAGFVIVSDPNTGRLLAAANISNDPKLNGRAWSLSYEMEPASVIKGIVAATAIADHRTSVDEIFDCGNGEYLYGHNLFHDWKAFGKLSVAEIQSFSSNIGGVKIGQRLGAQRLAKMLHDFGFGPGGITAGVPEAAPGEIPRPTQLTEEEYVGLMSTGYAAQAEFNITPLEILHAYSAIANGGRLMKPIAAADSESSAQVVRQVLDSQTAQEMKSVLARAVKEGTGQRARSNFYTTAGKTSSAFSPGSADHETLGGERAIAGFVGFAPVSNPRVAIYVAIIDPTNAEDHQPHGGQHAAPVFRKVAERVLRKMNVAPDQP